MSTYEKDLLDDVSARGGYGTPLAAWKNQQPFFRNPLYKGPSAALAPALADTFVNGVHILLKTTKVITIYRGYETAGLEAPYGREHPTFIQNLVSLRRPSIPDGMWWTPIRPSMSIDDLKVSDMHRAEDRGRLGITREWNRLDFYLEYALPVATMLYVGRAAPQQESAAYGQTKHAGYAFQFRLIQSLAHAIPQMKTHTVL